ncbi:ATP-binding cassette domain-containing protein [Roseateles sp.]|uniref:ATP-binding cassette domain-containing protein n=1 Tax=Roseateles sp. TaxID=1971397 RepID=UPI00391CDADB
MSATAWHPGSGDELPMEAARLREWRAVLETAGDSALLRCAPVQLMALGWRGGGLHLMDGLPLAGQAWSMAGFRQWLRGLGLRSRWTASVQGLLAGGLAVWPEGCAVYLGRHDGVDAWHDGEQLLRDWAPPAGARFLNVQSDALFQPVDAPQPGWMGRLLDQGRGALIGLFLISLVANLLALAVSLFTMVVYNHVIPSGATGTLLSVASGALLAVLAAWLLRQGRMALLARLGATLGDRVAVAAFRKTLGLPIETSERVGPLNHLNRLRSMESVRQYLSGGAGSALADAPFVLIFLLVIAMLGGWIVLVPVLGLLLFSGAAWLLHGPMQRALATQGRLSSLLAEDFANAVQRQRALQGLGGAGPWLNRQRALAEQAALAQLRLAKVQALSSSLSQALGSLMVLGTMVVGVALVLEGSMSMGGLIASMMLIWRVSSPAQQWFGMRVQWAQLQQSRLQIERLMMSTGDPVHSQQQSPVKPAPGVLQVERLSYRPAADQDFSLNGLSFELSQGEMLAVIGPNAAGKSLLLQCLAGLRSAQGGSIMLGAHELRQFDRSEYRAWVGYLPQLPRVLPLPIAAFLKLAHPAASEAELLAALRMAGGRSWYALMGAADEAQGLQTPLDPWRADVEGLRIRHLAAFAEALIGPPALLLLDDPVRDGDPVLEAAFLETLKALRGRCTIVMSTHRPEWIKAADKVLVLDRGNQIHFGPVVAAVAEQTPGAPA